MSARQGVNVPGLVSGPGLVLVAACSAFVAGVVAGQLLVPPAGPALGVALAAGAVVCALPGSSRVLVALVAAAACLGLARGALSAHVAGPGTVDGHLSSGHVTLEGTVREGTLTRSGTAVVVDARRITEPEGQFDVAGGVVAFLRTSGTMVPQNGDTVQVDSTGLRLPDSRPGAYSADVLERQDVQAIAGSAQVSVMASGGTSPARLLDAVRGALAAGVERGLPPTLAALLLGLAFGIHRAADPTVTAALQDSGLIHVTALSGLKVAIVAGLVANAAGRLAWAPRWRLLAVVTAIAGYTLLGGAGASALRSGLMATVALAGRTAGRQPDRLPLLALCAVVMLGASPSLFRDPGFQLSFLGTLGILLLAGPLGQRLPGPRWAMEPLAVTLAAQIATFPVTAATFHSIALVGPLANLLVLPLLPLAIVLGGAAAAVAVLVPPLGGAALQVAALPARWIELVATVMSRVPGAALHPPAWPEALTALVVIGAMAAVAGVVLARSGAAPVPRQPRGVPARPIAVLAVVALAVPAGGAAFTAATLAGAPHQVRLSVLDVGGGSAVLVTARSGATALIDAGGDPTRLRDALDTRLPLLHRRVDLLVLTGGSRLVAGGASGLPGALAVGDVVGVEPLTAAARAVLSDLSTAGSQVQTSPCGHSWSWQGLVWTLLPGDDGAVPTGTVCALQVSSGGSSALLLGDVTAPAQAALAQVAPPPALVVAPASGGLSPDLLTPASVQLALPAGRTPAGLPGAVAVRGVGTSGTLDYAFTDSSVVPT